MISCLIDLTNDEKYLLSRLSLRKIKWIRLSRINHYIHHTADDDDDDYDRDVLGDNLRGNDDSGSIIYDCVEENGQSGIASDGTDRLNIDGFHSHLTTTTSNVGTAHDYHTGSSSVDDSNDYTTTSSINSSTTVSHSSSHVHHDNDHQHRQASMIINRLDSLGILSVLHNKSTFDQAYEAIQTCFRLPELQQLLKTITKKQLMTGSSYRCSDRKTVLASIKSSILNQKTLFGELLSTKFAKIVLDVLRTLPPIVTTTTASKRSTNGHTKATTAHHQDDRPASTLSSSSTASMVVDKVISINEPVLHLYRRCQRLYQISSNNYQSSSSSSSSLSSHAPTTRPIPHQHRSSSYYSGNQVSSNISSDYASILVPLEFNAPLLVLFRKVKYPSYILYHHASRHGIEETLSSSQSSSSRLPASQLSSPQQVSPVSSSLIFPTRHHFIQWEAAVELYLACISKVMMMMITMIVQRLLSYIYHIYVSYLQYIAFCIHDILYVCLSIYHFYSPLYHI